MGFATKAAPDFRSRDPQLVGIHAQQRCALIAINEMALRTHPKLCRAIGRHIGETGMGLDIALVSLFGFVGFLNDKVGLGKARLNITMAIFSPLDIVGRLGWLWLNAIGKNIVMQQRCTGLQCLVHFRYVGQDFIIHPNQFQGFACRTLINCGNSSHGMTIIQHLFTRHAVFQNVAHAAITACVIGKISRRDNSFYTGQLFSFRRIDFLDPGMGMRGTQYQGNQLPWRKSISTKSGPSCHLVNAIRPRHPLADDFEFFAYK